MASSVDDGNIADVGHRLISSNRIEGTPVFDRYGKKIGAIHSVMIEKESGQVAYAVLTFGGFLGVGTRAYPLPWSMLTYDREQRGYCVELRFEDVEDAPYMTLDQADRPHVSQEPAYRHWDEYL
jgi:sporulation protein YlmC with PRC-barrel domain